MGKKPSEAETTSRSVGKISSFSSNASFINAIVQEQLGNQLDHNNMTWGRSTLLAEYPGQKGTGGQYLISNPVHNITPSHLKTVEVDDMKTLDESDNGSAIDGDSEHTDPEDDSENPDDLSDKVKQRILTNYMKEQKAKKKERQRRNRI